MTDYSNSTWELAVGAKESITSTKALYYQRQSGCKGLAKFLLSPEAQYFLKKGMKFIGVKFNNEMGAWWFVSVKHMDKEATEVSIMNSFNDFALFAK